MANAVALHLMFDGAAEEAMNYYVSIFKDSGINRIDRYAAGEPGGEGTVKQASFSIIVVVPVDPARVPMSI